MQVPRWLGQSLPITWGWGLARGRPSGLHNAPQGLTFPLSYHYGNREFPFRVPIVTDPVSMGTPHFHISAPVAITTPEITSPSPQVWALWYSPYHLSPAPFSCLGNKCREGGALVALR